MQTPLDDVPEHMLRQAMDYTARAVELADVGRHDWRIPNLIADQWLTRGFGTVDTNAFARRFGTTRRTVCMALKRLTTAGIIRPVGRTVDGKTMYEPVLSIVAATASAGDEGQRHAV